MMSSTTLPFSEACERNKDVILDVISPYLKQINSVLEIGSGTGQHAVHFARALPSLIWQTSDQTEYLDGIRAQLKVADVGNVIAPVELNVNQSPWLDDGQRFQGVYTANTFHIMTQADVMQFFKGLPSVVNAGAYLFIYGPFKYDDEFTNESNQRFDTSLRSRGVGSGIRDFEFIRELAAEAGFDLVEDKAMPANNQCLVWRNQSQPSTSF